MYHSLVLLTGQHSNSNAARSSDKLNRLGTESELSLLSPQSLVHLRRHLSILPFRTSDLIPVEGSPSRAGRPPRQHLNRPMRKLQPAEIDQLVERYQSGESLTGIAERLGIHRRTVSQHLVRRGVPLRSESPTLTTTQLQEVVRLYGTGLSTYKLAACFEVGVNTIRRALLAAGVTMRSRSGR